MIMKSYITSDVQTATMYPITNGFQEILMSFQWPWRRKKEIKIQVYDDSKRGEVTYTTINQTRIAFPAHSSHAIRYFMDTLSDTLGNECHIRKCEDNVWEITIKEK